MKTVYIIALMFFLSTSSQSQEYKELIFNYKLNRLITSKSKAIPTIFEVKEKKYEETIKTSNKKITQDYRNALEAIVIARNDSVKAFKYTKSTMVKSKAIEEVSMYINDFLRSKEKFELKKGILKDAQVISNKYSLGYLVYADNTINTHYKDKFISFSHKKKELKYYLQGIIERIDSNMKKIRENGNEENNQLKQARERLKNVEKYEILEGKIDVKNYNVLTLGMDVINPVEEITGYFEALGKYYVLDGKFKGYTTNQLVSAREVKLKKMKKENFVFRTEAVLIRHSITKNNYLVALGFVDQFAINKVANQDKFKGKTSFPDKVYTSNEEEKIDALIFNYKKTRIASMHDFD